MNEKIKQRMGQITNSETELIDIVIVVSRITGVKIEELRGKKQTRKISIARQIIIKLAYDTGTFSEKYLGNYFNRHHSTVDFARKSVSNLYDSDNYFRNKIENIKVLIKDKQQYTQNFEVFKVSQNEQ